jgi:hypothetical protein
MQVPGRLNQRYIEKFKFQEYIMDNVLNYVAQSCFYAIQIQAQLGDI